MYARINTYIYRNMYSCTRMCACPIHKHVQLHMNMCLYIYTNISIYTMYARIYVYLYRERYTYAYMYISIYIMYAHIYLYKDTYNYSRISACTCNNHIDKCIFSLTYKDRHAYICAETETYLHINYFCQNKPNGNRKMK